MNKTKLRYAVRVLSKIASGGILIFAAGCSIISGKTKHDGNFCDKYTPVRTREGNVLVEETKNEIGGNNAVYLKDCLGVELIAE